MDQHKNTEEIKLEIDKEIAKGTYSNLAIISHSPNEFTLDFATILPGMPKPDITNRMIMTPGNAKRLALMLRENILKYEQDFGEIKLEEFSKPAHTNEMNINNMGPLNGSNLS